MKHPCGELSEGMRVSGHLSRPLLLAAAGCLGTSACAPRPAPVVPLPDTTTAAQAPVAAPAAPLPPPTLHDLRWQLNRDGKEWTDAPPSLHAFTAGRWECALGEVLSDDALDASAFDLHRTRRLACTHATGATVQTQLTCTLHTARSSPPAAELGTSSAAATSSEASSAARELQLQLDATPPLQLRCAPSEVVALTLTSREKRTLAVLCRGSSATQECPASATAPTDNLQSAPSSP